MTKIDFILCRKKIAMKRCNARKQKAKEELTTLEEIVGSMAFLSRTKLPFLQNVRLALGSNKGVLINS